MVAQHGGTLLSWATRFQVWSIWTGRIIWYLGWTESATGIGANGGKLVVCRFSSFRANEPSFSVAHELSVVVVQFRWLRAILWLEAAWNLTYSTVNIDMRLKEWWVTRSWKWWVEYGWIKSYCSPVAPGTGLFLDHTHSAVQGLNPKITLLCNST